MKKQIINGFIHGLVFFLTILGCFVSYAAWSNITTKTTGTVITETIWNEIVNKVNDIGNTYAPTGFVGAFNLTTCPTGWIAADGTNGTPDLRGEFIRGLDSTRALGSKQPASKVMYSGGNPTPIYLDGGAGNYIISVNNGSSTVSLGNSNLENIASAPTHYATTSSWLIGFSSYATTSSTTSNYGSIRPNNTALLYCVKL